VKKKDTYSSSKNTPNSMMRKKSQAKCLYVYTDDSDVDFSRCPQCGRMNNIFRF